MSLEAQNRKYKYIDREDDDLRVIATLGYRFSPALNMSVSYRHLDRQSNEINQSFTENRAIFAFEYIPSWGR